MHSPPSVRIWIGLLVLIFGKTVLASQPVNSPLATQPDLIGSQLQRAFISAPAADADRGPGTFIAYRKSFHLDAVPKGANLHIFADARYLAWINGKLIGRGPNRFNPRGPEYDSLDVANALRSGSNTISVLVMGYAADAGASEGAKGIGQDHNSRMMNHPSGLTARLEVGGRPLLVTDTGWQWSDQLQYRPAKIEWANIVDRIDFRAETGDWTQPVFDDSAWAPVVRIDGSAWGPLSARRIPLLRDNPVPARLDAGASLPVTLQAGQQLHFSMGHLVQAWTELEIDASAGAQLTLNYCGVGVIARAGRQTYISSDTAAFDDGLITVKSGHVTILKLNFTERLYPFDLAGTFHSSDPFLNNLWSTCTRTLQVLSEDAYVDCADRERAEWMDCDPPDFDVTRVAMSSPGNGGRPIYADARLLGEMLRRTALTEQKEGWVKAHTCSDRFDIHAKMEDRACDWVEGARRYYDSTSDKALIREIWPVITAQMDYFLARRTARGLVLAREWVVWGNPVGYVTCEGAGINAFAYKALRDAAYLGGEIGEPRAASRFAGDADQLAAAFDSVLWDEKDGTYYSGYYPAEERATADSHARQLRLAVTGNLIAPTMFPALWALDQGIVPAQKRDRVASYLLQHRGEARRTMTYYYLFKQMYAADDNALDVELLDTIRAKWKPQADTPWGTCWEDFDGGSKAHCYGAFPAYFLSAYVLGVRPDLPVSGRRILIEPRLGNLQRAEGKVVTEFGIVPVSWTMESGALAFRVTVPAGTSAHLRLLEPAPHCSIAFAGKAAPSHESGHYLEAILTPGTYSGHLQQSSVLQPQPNRKNTK